LPVTTICKPSRELGKIQKIANNVPVEYLLNRQSSMYFLNPRLGQRSFNTTLYNAIRLKKHSTYGVYQLLSSLPENMLTGNESLVMKEARDELIKANTMQSEIWVFSGTYRYYWEYPNEKEEANTNATNWCKRQNGDMDELTSKGYKTEKSVPESRSTNGWVRQDYPNGEFQGYVNFKAQCDGATYTMIKKGTVDTESENTSRRLDYEGRNI
jgi:hypothetical protein